MKKRILACLLALVMLIGVLPVMALADDAPTAVRSMSTRRKATTVPAMVRRSNPIRQCKSGDKLKTTRRYYLAGA